MGVDIHCLEELPGVEDYDAFVIAGPPSALTRETLVSWLPEPARPVWKGMVGSLSPGDSGGVTTTWIPGADGPRKLSAIALSERVSRHNCAARPDVLAGCLEGRASRPRTLLVVALADAAHAIPSAVAVARAFPTYATKGRVSDKKAAAEDKRLDVVLLGPDGPVTALDAPRALIDSVRLAGELVDMPAAVLHTDAYVERARAIAAELGVACDVIDFEQLQARGFGGLVGVGRASVHKPALVHLRYAPEGAKTRLAWVGKGIVYDTGGLSIKGKANMPGMKGDMGGSAAVLGAFRAAVILGLPVHIDALLCLAENSVGPESTRPDDVLSMYSGKTVEVNNTDAEGRLVLADGVAYASKHLAPDVIVDVATLTGAQLVATGKRHAAIVCNDDDLETRAIRVGRACGDLVHPLPYCPELFRGEFRSKIADMKNSVKDRMNAQASCAGQFVAEHLAGYEGPWLHVDIAGPSDNKERGTGFGVALLVALAQDQSV